MYVEVPANEPYFDTGIDVTRGQVIAVFCNMDRWCVNPAHGNVQSVGKYATSGNAGYLAPGAPEGALIASIRTPEGDYTCVTPIGSGCDFNATASGRLCLGPNDDLTATDRSGYADNVGSIRVDIEIV